MVADIQYDNLPAWYLVNKENLILECNKKFIDLIKLDPAKIIGTKLGALSIFRQVSATLQKIKKNNKNALEKNTLLFVKERLNPNGTDVSQKAIKIPVNDNLLTIYLDITELLSKKENLNEKKEMELVMSALLSSLPEHIYWQDREGIILGCNDKQAEALGFSSRLEVVGKSPYDLLPKNEADHILHILKKVIYDKKPISVEESITFKGEIREMLSEKIPFRDQNGAITGILGISFDITQRKKIEQELKVAKERAEAASKAKTEFLENMRHDIRTPLIGITGFAGIIAEESKDPKIQEYVDHLVASSYALNDLLNEILEAVKVGWHEIPLLKQKFDLKNKLSDVIKLTKVRALQKNIDLTFNYDEKIPHFLMGDPKRIHRIVLELVTNALNFTDKGFVKLSAKLEEEAERKILLRIEVEDTGIGISPEKRQEVFIHFKRLTPSYEGIYKGAGLGLFIIKKFVEELDGEIYIESREAEGTRFIIILPLKKSLLQSELGIDKIESLSGREPIREVVHEVVIEDSQLEETEDKSRILLVEDQEIAAHVVMNMLSHLACKVDHAKNGEQAIKLFQEKHYHLVFMDIGLPEMDGYEVTRRMRLFELNKESHVPIIALTAHVDDENKQHCIDVGMNAALSKPLTKEKAADILNAFIPYREPAFTHTQEKSQEETPIEEAINVNKLNQLYSGDQAIIREILQLVIEDYPEELNKMKKAYAKGDWEAVYFVVHKLKGGANYYAADRLVNICSELEQAIKGKKEDKKMNELYSKVLSELESVLGELKGMLNL